MRHGRSEGALLGALPQVPQLSDFWIRRFLPTSGPRAETVNGVSRIECLTGAGLCGVAFMHIRKFMALREAEPTA